MLSTENETDVFVRKAQTNATMKTITSAILFLASLCSLTSSAFVVPSAFTRSMAIFSEPNSSDEEEEGFDLNLEEMFEVFDAADQDQDFDEAIKKVKGS
jgi:hypothetical protein